jgi:hypothetical protein
LVTVFPNPTSGLFQINIPASNQVSYVSVVSALGETVIHKNTIEAGLTSTTFDLSNFVNGVYFVTIENENGKAVKKVSLNK